MGIPDQLRRYEKCYNKYYCSSIEVKFCPLCKSDQHLIEHPSTIPRFNFVGQVCPTYPLQIFTGSTLLGKYAQPTTTFSKAGGDTEVLEDFEGKPSPLIPLQDGEGNSEPFTSHHSLFTPLLLTKFKNTNFLVFMLHY